jgi:hypothetical protein
MISAVATAVRSGWLFRLSALSSCRRIARANRARYSSARRRSSGMCRRANTHARFAREPEDRGRLSSASAASAGRLIGRQALVRCSPPGKLAWKAGGPPTALPECGVRAWLSPKDHGDPYDTTHPSIRIFLNRSSKDRWNHASPGLATHAAAVSAEVGPYPRLANIMTLRDEVGLILATVGSPTRAPLLSLGVGSERRSTRQLVELFEKVGVNLGSRFTRWASRPPASMRVGCSYTCRANRSDAV